MKTLLVSVWRWAAWPVIAVTGALFFASVDGPQFSGWLYGTAFALTGLAMIVERLKRHE